MKKSKGQTVDLLYTKKEEIKKTKSVGSTSSRPQKSKKRNIQSNNKETINLDNEIIIGLTHKKEEQKKKEKKQTVKKTKKNTKKNKKIIKKNPVNPKKVKIIKLTILIVLIFGAIVMFMMSSTFNIKQIIVTNNTKISTEEIIKLSKLTIDTNMFKVSNNSINNNIKINPYIENVKLKRSLNGKIILEVKERIATYMLQFGNSYVYINNQGYMLEISEEKLDLPILVGFETNINDIKEGNRLNNNDLIKLEDAIKIVESAKVNSLDSIITSINIEEEKNYKINIESEKKIIHFGEAKNINVKFLKIEEVIKQEKDIAGEIYFQDEEKTVFKEMVNF